MAVQPGLCQTLSKSTLLVFSRCSSNQTVDVQGLVVQTVISLTMLLRCQPLKYISHNVRKPTMWILTQTRLCSHRIWLETWNLGLRKKRDCTIPVAKTKTLISLAVTAKLICVFVFAYAKHWFSHDTAHMLTTISNTLLFFVGKMWESFAIAMILTFHQQQKMWICNIYIWNFNKNLIN